MHGRSSLVESFVWLIPFLCGKEEKKREDEREKKREDERENERENEEREMKRGDFFPKKYFKTLKPAR